jgi:apolipoprotein N-acyltransferase
LLAGAFGWDELGWSTSRTGLVNVGGIGGILVGSFVTLMIEGVYPRMDERINAAVVLASAAAGKGVATYFTRRFDSNSRTKKALSNLSILPAIDARGGMGATVRLAY